MDGGGHERGRRSGTLNVPGIVGLGKACELAGQLLDTEGARLTALRERLWAGIRARLTGVHLNGHASRRLPGTLHVRFDGIDAQALLTALREVALSATSACSSGSGEPSHVLRALGLPAALALASVRFGLGRRNTEAEVDYVCERLAAEVTRLRALQGQPAGAGADRTGGAIPSGSLRSDSSPGRAG
jgi:cysteine desulfurase